MAWTVTTFTGYEDTKQYNIVTKIGVRVICVVQEAGVKGLLTVTANLQFFVVTQNLDIINLSQPDAILILKAYAATL